MNRLSLDCTAPRICASHSSDSLYQPLLRGVLEHGTLLARNESVASLAEMVTQ